MSKYYLIRTIKVLLFWSLGLFISLLLLEDLKPFLVRIHFSPHWLVVVIVLLFLLQLLTNDSWQPKIPSKKRLILFSWLVAIACCLIVYFLATNKVFGILFGFLLFYLILFINRFLLKNLLF